MDRVLSDFLGPKQTVETDKSSNCLLRRLRSSSEDGDLPTNLKQHTPRKISKKTFPDFRTLWYSDPSIGGIDMQKSMAEVTTPAEGHLEPRKRPHLPGSTFPSKGGLTTSKVWVGCWARHQCSQVKRESQTAETGYVLL